MIFHFISKTLRPKKFLTPLAHIFLWSCIVYILYIFRSTGPVKEFKSPTVKAISFLPMIALFYIHSLVLVPRFLMKRKRMQYFLLALALVLCIAAFCSFIVYYYAYHFDLAPGFDPSQFPLIRIVGPRIGVSLVFLGASTGYGVLREYDRVEKLRKEKENENLRTELSFLRSQVNPHFMLNVINSMVSLARRKPDQLEPVLIELASLMNYMLYELDNEKVMLEDELEYLQSYINLQLLRFGNDVRVNFNVHKTNEQLLIEPMLLIPLVENAFKHGIGMFVDPEIDISIRVPANNELYMTVKNKFDELTISKKNIINGKEKNCGIGLNNLKKRLSLIYPDKFDLNTKTNGNWFIASLNLQLS